MFRLKTKIDWRDIFLKSWHPYAWIIVLIYLLYYKSLFFDYTFLDDHELIMNQMDFLSNLKNLPAIFSSDVFFSSDYYYYRPLLNISFMFDAIIGQGSLGFFHFSNIIFHALSACLLFVLLKKLKFREDLSFFFTLLFSLHPVLTQAVAWLPGRNDSLLTLFFLLSFIAFINFWKKKKLLSFIFFVVCFVMALITKETAAFFPFVYVFYILFFLPKNKEERRLRATVIGGQALIVLAWILARKSVLLAAEGTLDLGSILHSFWLNFAAFLVFLGKAILPFKLSVVSFIADEVLWFGLVSLLFLLFLFIKHKEQKGWRFWFGLFWFALFIVPTLLLNNPELGVDFNLEHRLYLPIIGLIIFLLNCSWFQKITWKKWQQLSAVLVLIIFFILSWRHINNFSDRITFWENAVRTSPSSAFCHRNLGAMYYLDNRFDESLAETRKAMALRPTEKMVHNNIGLIYFRQEKYSQALEEYNKELELNPLYDVAWYNLGLLYYRLGELDKAAKAWHNTLVVNPEYLDAIYALQALAEEQKNTNNIND